MDPFKFEEVTLLITHYNRSISLGRLLMAFRDLNCVFAEIIVSDDGSGPDHLGRVRRLQDEFDFKLVTTPYNKGLGNNINKGQKEVRSPYTLYVQEDFIPAPVFPERLSESLSILNEDSQIDFIRFFALFRYPDLRSYNDHFSSVFFNKWNMSHLKFFCYSDNPHLRRSSFFKKFGEYKEGWAGDVTEFVMSLSFFRIGGKALIAKDYDKVFIHQNSNDEPSMMERKPWRHKKDFFIRVLRAVYLKYRLIKNTVQLYRYPKIK